MQNLLSYLRLALVASCLCCAGLAMAGVTLTAQERSLGEMLPGSIYGSVKVSPNNQRVASVDMQ